MCPTSGVSIGPVQDASHVPGAIPARGCHAPQRRVVEACVRSCDGVDRFDRRPPLEPYDAPPGSVPYHRYIEAQNRIDRLSAHAEARTPRAEAPERPEAARIGDVPPTPEQPEPARPAQSRTYHEYREAMTGRLIDVVF
ncbi:MAG: hypothetical protein ACIARR_13130 [Phycisphaerales bacterium JB059]